MMCNQPSIGDRGLRRELGRVPRGRLQQGARQGKVSKRLLALHTLLGRIEIRGHEFIVVGEQKGFFLTSCSRIINTHPCVVINLLRWIEAEGRKNNTCVRVGQMNVNYVMRGKSSHCSKIYHSIRAKCIFAYPTVPLNHVFDE